MALSFPGTNRRTKTAKETAEAFQAHFEMVLNQDRQVDESVLEEIQQRADIPRHGRMNLTTGGGGSS